MCGSILLISKNIAVLLVLTLLVVIVTWTSSLESFDDKAPADFSPEKNEERFIEK